MRQRKGITPGIRALPVFLAFFVLTLAGCKSSSVHFVEPGGRSLQEVDYLWLEVDKVFPKALPERVILLQVSSPHSSFMIETNTIGIPSGLKTNIRRGKICRELTHLALHNLSGGDRTTRGHCFDNDVVFLEQAVAGYLDRKTSGILEQELEAASRIAARMFRAGELGFLALRDWESFYYRGYWSDQFEEWNIQGLRALTTLGDYFERNYSLSTLAPVFKLLGSDRSLDDAVKEVFKTDLDTLLTEWREEILARVPEDLGPEQAGDSSLD